MAAGGAFLAIFPVKKNVVEKYSCQGVVKVFFVIWTYFPAWEELSSKKCSPHFVAKALPQHLRSFGSTYRNMN